MKTATTTKQPTTTLNIRNISVDAAQRLKAGAARMGLTLPQFLLALANGARWNAQKARLENPTVDGGWLDWSPGRRRHQSTR